MPSDTLSQHVRADGVVSPPAATAINWKTVILASLGGAIEFYDFIVYGIFAQYIAATFFPAADPLTSLLGAFAAFAVGYLSRPLGGFVLGSLGDRIGRRSVFLLSLVMMSLSTLGMAFLPGHATLGVAATVLFVALRFLQGFCVGGELPGAITYVVEVAPRRAALACGIVFFFVNTGVFLASSVSTVLHEILTPTQMQDFGWRLAFGLGAMLGIVSYFLRTALHESPAFQEMVRSRAQAPRLPLRELFARHKGPLLVGIGANALTQAFNGALFVAMAAYMTKVAGYDGRTTAASINLGIGVLSLGILAVAWLADSIPPRVLHRIGAALFVLGSYAAYAALVRQSVSPYLVFTLIGLAGAFANGTFGIILAELFPTEVRFSGVAAAYNLASAVFGGFAPIVIGWLVAATGDKAAPGFYLMAVGGIALIANLFLHRRGFGSDRTVIGSAAPV